MIFKCKMCGGDIELKPETKIAKCLYCKSTMTLPQIDDEKILNLYNRANNLRLQNEFDKAYAIYESILELDDKQVEAHWGLVLSKYGVEYVDDPKTKKKIPTCHRTIIDSVLSNSDYLYCKENSIGESLELYKEEAKKINDIQRKILEISNNEDPYDIFICYKESTDTNERTLDSVLAQDIYEKLIDKGYKVFFARKTLEGKLGTEYEPYIFSALNTSRIMLVVGTSESNLNAVWVKNEWSRYLDLMKKDKNKVLIPVYSKMDAYELPESFSMLQAQNMDKVGSMQDLLDGVNKIMSSSIKKSSTLEVTDNEVFDRFKKMIEEEKIKEEQSKKYDVTIIVEKISNKYIITSFIISGLIGSLMIAGYFLPYFKGFTSLTLFNSAVYKYLLPETQIIVGLLTLTAFISSIINRPLNKLSKCLYFLNIGINLVFFLDTWYRNVHFNMIFFITFILQIVLLVLKPKWNLVEIKDEATKSEIEEIEKENKKVKTNYELNESKPHKKPYYVIPIIIVFIGMIILNAKPLEKQSNDSDENVNQIQITIDAIRLRIAPNTSSKQIGIVYKNEIYTVLETIGKSGMLWYKITTKNGIEGYICGKNDNIEYVIELNTSDIENSLQSNKRDTSLNQLKVTNSYINIRKSTSASSELVGKVYQNEIYTILDVEKAGNANWYKITTKNGLTGYITGGDNNEYVEVLSKSN